MTAASDVLILAPLRGVTIRAFRRTFAAEIAEAGFDEAVTPFIAAAPGFDPLGDRELRGLGAEGEGGLRVTPQFIGKDPAALGAALGRIREAGFVTADLNCGCPFQMVRNKGRGAGLLRNPALLEKMLAAGCEAMGPGNFSVKTRLGVERPDELLALMPVFNAHPLRFLTVHARTARQMYEGECDWSALEAVRRVAKVPLVVNGDLSAAGEPLPGTFGRMVGRGFVRALGARADACELLTRYAAASREELAGDAPALGRLKELLAYWKELPRWRRRWAVAKLARSLDEFLLAVR